MYNYQIGDKDTVKPEKSKSLNFFFMWINDYLSGLKGLAKYSIVQ